MNEVVPYLSTVIVVATLATVVLAVFSYIAFKVRDRRRPKEELSDSQFFRRYQPEGVLATGGPEELPVSETSEE